MKTKKEFCHNCKGPRGQVVMGFMPTIFTEGEYSPNWRKALVCSTCGDMNYEPVNNDEVDRAHERYVRVLVELGLETKKSVKEKTGIEL